MSRKPQTIVVYFNGTFANRLNGAHVRTWSLLEWLTSNFPQVTLYSYHNHPDCPWSEKEVEIFRHNFPDVTLVLEKYSSVLRLWTRFKNIILVLSPTLGVRILEKPIPWLSPIWRRLLRDKKPLIIANYIDSLTELNGVDTSLTVIETHDLKFLNYAKTRGLRPEKLRVLGKLRSELASARAVSALIAISPVEQAFFQQMVPSQSVFYVPAYFHPVTPEHRRGPKKFDLLFVGSSNELNVSGLAAFLEHQQWHRGFTVGIAGEVCRAPLIKALARRFTNLRLLGFVSDLGPLYAEASAAISPVEGTGLKIKVVEALAHGVPVLASSHTISGLPEGYQGCVSILGEREAQFLFNDPECLADASEAARQYMRSDVWKGDLEELRRTLTSE